MTSQLTSSLRRPVLRRVHAADSGRTHEQHSEALSCPADSSDRSLCWGGTDELLLQAVSLREAPRCGAAGILRWNSVRYSSACNQASPPTCRAALRTAARPAPSLRVGVAHDSA
mmetsp:Transcript_34213/g.46093  ORF Transcript_34213/g.46093 Transcript_34213/m.46093 type:complete len:114 (-) Transcript_34213:398-739(-)